MAKKREIRNSTAEFLTFVAEGKENGIQVLYKDETIWATQKAMAALFDVGIPAINKHLANIFVEGELKKEATVSKMEIVQTEGNREVKRMMELYNLDAIISVGYRVNSIRATQFRQWCTNSSQPDIASLLKISDLLEVDIKELIVREYETFMLSKISNNSSLE